MSVKPLHGLSLFDHYPWERRGRKEKKERSEVLLRKGGEPRKSAARFWRNCPGHLGGKEKRGGEKRG